MLLLGLWDLHLWWHLWMTSQLCSGWLLVLLLLRRKRVLSEWSLLVKMLLLIVNEARWRRTLGGSWWLVLSLWRHIAQEVILEHTWRRWSTRLGLDNIHCMLLLMRRLVEPEWERVLTVRKRLWDSLLRRRS